MGLFTRLLGVLVMVGGVGVVGKQAGGVTERILDVVRGMVATYEMGTIRDRILGDYEVTASLPPTDDDQALADYIHEVTRARSGARDTALDPWNNPYRFTGWADGWYLLYSMGPGGEQDECASEDAGGDDVCAFIELPRTDSVYKPIPR